MGAKPPGFPNANISKFIQQQKSAKDAVKEKPKEVSKEIPASTTGSSSNPHGAISNPNPNP